MVQYTRKVTEPDFSAKLPLAKILAKRAKRGPKIEFSNKMLDIMVRMYGTPSICLGKTLV